MESRSVLLVFRALPPGEVQMKVVDLLGGDDIALSMQSLCAGEHELAGEDHDVAFLSRILWITFVY